MKNIFYTLFIFFLVKFSSMIVFATADDFYAKDQNAKYNKYFPDIDIVIEIPGYKLDPENSLKIPIGDEEYKYAQVINREISEKAAKYIEYKKLSSSKDYYLYAAKNLKDYILLYFNEPQIMDGGFELIYSKKLNKIIGTFIAGYKG